MGNLVKRSSGRVFAWLNRHHVAFVVLLSLLHIGLSCIHVRDSGGADRWTASESRCGSV